MTGLAIRFIAGRFHATPWGRHVNEGVPEWPPSPWRLLRSLVATWKRKLDDRPGHEQVRGLIGTLLDEPEFILPPAGTGHSRHFMPLWFKKGPYDRTLVFDTFVALPKDAEVVVLWPSAVLPPDQGAALELLAEHLQFLGRAESWCSARVLDEAEVGILRARVNCRPLNGTRPDEQDLVRMLCADPARALANDAFTRTISRRRGEKAVTETQKSVTYDPDWHLCADTLWLHEERWSDPPGSRWVTYERPKDCFKITPVRQSPARARPRPQVARFALDSNVLPLVTDTLPVAEAARRNLMGLFGRLHLEPDGSRGRSPVFAGKDATGNALQGHRHAFYLPTDDDGDGRLDHLTIFAEDGFGSGELRALDRLRQIKTAAREASGHPLRVLLLGLGTLNDYRAGPVGPSAVWESATPFLVTRHLKTRGRKRDDQALRNDRVAFVTTVLREELVRLVARRPDLAGIAVENILISPLVGGQGAFRCGARSLQPIEFRRFRRKRSDDGGRRPAGAFRIVFPRAIRGPIALGHSSHFGMGLFVPRNGDGV